MTTFQFPSQMTPDGSKGTPTTPPSGGTQSTPTASTVLGVVDLLLLTKLDSFQRNLLDSVAEHMRRMIQNPGEVSIHQKVADVKGPAIQCDLEGLIDAVVEPFARTAQKNGLEFNVVLGRRVPGRMVLDSNLLRQILSNLLDNAVKFTRKGGILLRVSAEGGVTSRQLRFEVCDTGIGMPPEAATRCFPHHSRLPSPPHPTKSDSATSLVATQDLVRVLGGRIGVSNPNSGGSNFWFTIPLGIVGDAPHANVRSVWPRAILHLQSPSILESLTETFALWNLATERAETPDALVAAIKANTNSPGSTLVVIEPTLLTPRLEALIAPSLESSPRIRILTAGPHPAPHTEALSWDPTFKRSALAQALTAKPKPAPPAPVPTPPAPVPTTHATPLSTPVGTPLSLSVLVAEDDVVNQTLMQALLQKLGCICEIAPNGRVALECVTKNHFDVLLMDCQMPEMDGYTAAREIRKIESKHRMVGSLRIIAVTATARPDQAEACQEAGIDDFLIKPIRLEAMRHVLTGVKDSPGFELREDAAIRSSIDEMVQFISPEAAIRILATFLEETPSRMTQLLEVAGKKDAHATRMAAHTIKGSCGTFGAIRCATMARYLEKACQETFPANGLFCANAINAAFTRSLPTYKNLLSELQKTVQQAPVESNE